MLVCLYQKNMSAPASTSTMPVAPPDSDAAPGVVTTVAPPVSAPPVPAVGATRCPGCWPIPQPNQQAHMEWGGCLADSGV